MLGGLAVATDQLQLDPGVTTFTHRALATVALVVWFVFVQRASSLLLSGAKGNPDRFRAVEERTFPLFDNFAKLIILAAAVYLAITIWHVDATAWLASAGIVGLAVGFAAKDTLSNLFAGIFIIADAPYQIGDYILLDSGERGKVEHIGLRSTRLLTRDDIEVTVPNAVMGTALITNETQGPSRQRLRVKVGVAYGCDIDQVREVLLEVAGSDEGVCPTPEPRVRFRSFGESGLDLELLVWVPHPELRGRILDTLNTTIYKRFAAAGIEIPYPKRDLYIKAMPGTEDALG
jgi:small-conductance mechanosensitive channel